MIGCRYNAKNTLVKNYLYLAERRGVRIVAGAQGRRRRAARRAPTAPTATGHDRAHGRLGAQGPPHETARGVVFAAGRAGHQHAAAALPGARLAAARLAPARLPRAHEQRGAPGRHRGRRPTSTSAERIAITRASTPTPTPTSRPSPTAAAAARWRALHAAGRRGDAPDPAAEVRSGEVAAQPAHAAQDARAGRLVQAHDHPARDADARQLDPPAPDREALRPGVRLQTEQDPDNPNPTYIAAANDAAERLAEQVGGNAQSSIFEALANIPTTAHILGGAVIGADPEHGVVDADGRVFGYENMLVSDGVGDPGEPRRQPEPHHHRAGRAHAEQGAGQARRGARGARANDVGGPAPPGHDRARGAELAAGSIRIFACRSGSASALKAPSTPARPTVAGDHRARVDLPLGEHVQRVAELERRVADHEAQVDLLVDRHRRLEGIGADADADDDHAREQRRAVDDARRSPPARRRTRRSPAASGPGRASRPARHTCHQPTPGGGRASRGCRRRAGARPGGPGRGPGRPRPRTGSPRRGRRRCRRRSAGERAAAGRVVAGDDRPHSLRLQHQDHPEPDRAAADHDRYLLLATSPRRTACRATAIGSVSAATSGDRPLGTGSVSDSWTTSCSA